jgi:hypothetical protein
MRIWHEDLIPKLCQKHLSAMWREGLGAYKIINENRTDLSYWKHPATQEFIYNLDLLHERLRLVREEMLKRAYNPKELPVLQDLSSFLQQQYCKYYPWQTLDEQIAILKTKNCKCNI